MFKRTNTKTIPANRVALAVLSREERKLGRAWLGDKRNAAAHLTIKTTTA